MECEIKVDDFWNMTEIEFHAHIKAYNSRINKIAWLNGMYTSNALNCALGNMFLEAGKNPLRYPSNPYGNEDRPRSGDVSLSDEDKQAKAQEALCDVY